jgi:PilZ domain
MHVSEQDLELYARGRLESPGEVEFHVESCASCRDKLCDVARFISDIATLSRQQEIHGPEKRREQRIPTNDEASMRVLNPPFSGRESVQILDASRNGLRVRTLSARETGSIVQLRIKDVHVLGEVRYCLKVDDGYNIGIQIQDMH